MPTTHEPELPGTAPPDMVRWAARTIRCTEAGGHQDGGSNEWWVCVEELVYAVDPTGEYPGMSDSELLAAIIDARHAMDAHGALTDVQLAEAAQRLVNHLLIWQAQHREAG